MGVYYRVYAEINYEGKWCSLCPEVKDARTGRQKLVEVMWGQSALRELVNDLAEHFTSKGLPVDLSPEVRSQFRSDLDESCDDLFWDDYTWADYYRDTVFTVDFDHAVAGRIRKDRPFKYAGYVPKTLACSHEVGEADDIFAWLTQDEYEQLTPEARMEYQYYEWNNRGEEYGLRYQLCQRIEHLQEWFLEAQKKWWANDCKTRLIIEQI